MTSKKRTPPALVIAPKHTDCDRMLTARRSRRVVVFLTEAALAPRGLGQVLAAVELVTEDDTVGCDLILARGWVMGTPAGLENGQRAFEP